MLRYRIIRDKFESNFIMEINVALTQGWHCQGGICVLKDAFDTIYYQAMIKDEQ